MAGLLTAADLQAFHAGDDRYWRTLLGSIDRDLRAVARRYGYTGPDLDDVIQETWTLAFEHRCGFANRGPLGLWLRRICRSVCVTLLRRQRSHFQDVPLTDQVSAYAFEDYDRDPYIDTAQSIQDIYDRVDDQIVNLPSLQRRVAALRWLCGLSIEKIANELNVAPGTVKAELYRARHRLRERLGSEMP